MLIDLRNEWMDHELAHAARSRHRAAVLDPRLSQRGEHVGRSADILKDCELIRSELVRPSDLGPLSLPSLAETIRGFRTNRFTCSHDVTSRVGTTRQGSGVL